MSSGWEPPPSPNKPNGQWYDQYNLRFTPALYPARRNLGVVLAPSSAKITSAEVGTERVGETEMARIGDDLDVDSKC